MCVAARIAPGFMNQHVQTGQSVHAWTATYSPQVNAAKVGRTTVSKTINSLAHSPHSPARIMLLQGKAAKGQLLGSLRWHVIERCRSTKRGARVFRRECVNSEELITPVAGLYTSAWAVMRGGIRMHEDIQVGLHAPASSRANR